MYVCMYVCMYGRIYSKSTMDQPGKAVNPAVVTEQGKLIFPCPLSRLRIWSRETGSAVLSRVRQLMSILRLDLVLPYGIPSDFFRGGVHLFIQNHHTPSGQSRVHRVTQLRIPMTFTAESPPTQGQ